LGSIRDGGDGPSSGTFAVHFTASGRLEVVGRPGWSTAGRSIPVNQDASRGQVEDRRHLLHWDEQLKPLLNRVFSALRREHPGDFHARLSAPLKDRRWERLPGDPEKLMIRVATEINGAAGNLVADRADVNKAIEHVRENLRKYAAALQGNADYVEDIVDLPPVVGPERMARYHAMAEAFFRTDRNETAITARMSEIHLMILEDIRGCQAPCHLWQLIHDLAYSVTFDLSANATRDKVQRTLAWQRKMAANFGAPAVSQYEDLLGLLA